MSKLPYNVRVTICSFLNPSSVLNLSAVNRATHRCCTSRDFDQTYWKYMALDHNTSFSDVLKPEKHIRLAKDPLMQHHHQTSECHWSICTINQNKELEERGILSCTDGCHWRFEYIQRYAIPSSLHTSLFFIKYPIVCFVVKILIIDFTTNMCITSASTGEYSRSFNSPRSSEL